MTFCVTATLFMIIPIRSVTVTKTYNPWADINNDGKVDLSDLVLLALSYGTSGTPIQRGGSILSVYFSPNGGCEQAVVNWINEANSTIHILMYDFTLTNISQALINAKSRNVTVEVVFDQSEIAPSSMYWTLRTADVLVRNCTNTSGLMHNKVMVVDGYIVLTGSFNWSNEAEKYNNENLIVIDSAYVASQYEADFQSIWNAGV
jgi:phosphatidylserine/phosphatidylglycerophosphate/cardiolipin synthase-like enzyme